MASKAPDKQVFKNLCLSKEPIFETINQFGLRSVVLRNCNGDRSFSFSKAFIACDPAKPTGCPIGYAYQDGVKYLFDAFIGKRSESADDFEKNRALDCIQQYFDDDFGKHEKCLKNLNECDTEVQVHVLAAHLFGPLVPDDFAIDKHQKKIASATCPSCDKKLNFEDTSFGNSKVWHGRTDIVLHKSAALINVKSTRKRKEPPDDDIDEDASDCSASTCSSTNSAVEVKTNLDKICMSDAESQAMAQTITNAFCESNVNSRLASVFIPSFLATNENVKMFLYCCSKDGLLESWNMPILNGDSINVCTVIILWLAINFDSFKCVDIYSEKSNFQTLVEPVLEIYRKELYRPVNTEQHYNESEQKQWVLIDKMYSAMDENEYPQKKQIEAYWLAVKKRREME